MSRNTPVLTSYFALARCLAAFARRLGMDGHLARITAIDHLEQPSIMMWHEFFSVECGTCTKVPDNCSYLNPMQEQCAPGQSIDGLASIIASQIESGRVRACPAKEIRL